MIALAIYFCFSDVILLCQTLYYNHVNAAKDRQSSIVSVIPEEEPLLSHRRSSDTIGLPGSHRRRSSAVDHHNGMNKITEEEEQEASADSLSRNLINVVAVMLIGTAGWFIAWKAGVWTPVSGDGGGSDVNTTETPLGASILGYCSAVLYLGYVASCLYPRDSR